MSLDAVRRTLARRERVPLPVRVVIGLVLAPLVPAVVISVAVFHDPIWGLFACILACPAAVCLGTPAYFVLRRWLAPTMLNGAIVGGLSTTLPVVFVVLTTEPPSQANPFGVVAALVQQFTTADRLGQAIALALVFCVGASGGLVFWWVVAPTAAPAAPARRGAL